MSIHQVKNAEIWCAQRVSNLEGQLGIDLGSDYQDLGKLDARVYRLEQRSSINTSPAMLKITSDSLMYRVRRLDRRSAHLRRLTLPYYPVSESTAEELLKAILSRLVDMPLGWAGQEELSSFGALSQQLCHAAGQRNIQPPDELDTFCQLHAFAAELTLEIEPQRHNIPQFLVSANSRRSRKPGKACCGCCSCFCHREKHVVNKRNLWWKTPRWMKNLRFFKTKRDDSSGTTALEDD